MDINNLPDRVHRNSYDPHWRRKRIDELSENLKIENTKKKKSELENTIIKIKKKTYSRRNQQ